MFFIGILVTVVPSAIQGRTTVGDFTTSPTEHVIIQLDKPFFVQSVRGRICREQGDRGPLPDVLFEIEGPGSDKTIQRAITDENGRFRIGRVTWGTYKFKTTLNGFQSIMGTITVSKNAAKRQEIQIYIPVGD